MEPYGLRDPKILYIYKRELFTTTSSLFPGNYSVAPETPGRENTGTVEGRGSVTSQTLVVQRFVDPSREPVAPEEDRLVPPPLECLSSSCVGRVVRALLDPSEANMSVLQKFSLCLGLLFPFIVSRIFMEDGVSGMSLVSLMT